MISFSHSGDVGDLIYSLPAIKAICEKENTKAEIALWPHPSGNTRDPMTVERAHNVGVLLNTQPYINSWRFFNRPVKVRYNFDEWRAKYDGFSNIAHSQCSHFGVDPSVCDEHWIDVNPVKMMLGKEQLKVCVIRSHRYRQHSFPWIEVAEKFPDAAVLGSTGEAEEMLYLYGFWNHPKTETMLEMASVIAGCDIVVTNQTAARAIAEGIKHPCVLMERWDFCPNVDFVRPGVYDGDAVREFLSRQSAIPSVRDTLIAEAHKAQAAANVPPAVQEAPKLKPAAKAPTISGIRKEAAQG